MESPPAPRDVQRVTVNRLREIRTARGLTQQDIADATGFSVPQISKWESGYNQIPSGRLPTLARAYGCSIGEIYDVPTATPPAAQVVALNVLLPSEADLTRMFEELLKALPAGSLRTQAEYLAATFPPALGLLAAHGSASAMAGQDAPAPRARGDGDDATTNQD